MSFFSKNGRKTENGKVKSERENGKPPPINIAVATVVAKWSRSPKKTCNTEFANM